MQFIVDNQKRFWNAFVGIPSFVNDAQVFKLSSLDHKVIEGNFVINNGHEDILWPSIQKIRIIPYYFGWCYYISNQNYATLFLKSCMIDSCVVTRMCLGTLSMFWKKIQWVFAKDQLIYPFVI
jgi:hypothetical protein